MPEHAAVRAAVTPAVAAAANEGITQDVLVLGRHSGATIFSSGADRKVPALSIAKLLFAVDVLDSAGGTAKVDPGTLGQLREMIATSDDGTAQDFYDAGGQSAIVERMAQRYHLSDTEPAPNPEYWGDIQITAGDMASFLQQVLADPAVGPFMASAMQASTPTAWDGFDQEFGMNAVNAAASKQGWGCCLGGVVGIHSVGFTADEIVVVLSTAAPDAGGLDVPQISAFEDDPGFRASVAAVTATVRAAVSPGSG